MFFRIGVLKNFENLIGKCLCWSLFLINFVKIRLLHRCFPVKFVKHLFYWTPLAANSVFCMNFVHIIYRNASFLTIEDSIWLQLIYFLTVISLWFVKCLFPIDGTVKLITFRVFQNLLCILSLKSTIMENSRHCIN